MVVDLLKTKKEMVSEKPLVLVIGGNGISGQAVVHGLVRRGETVRITK